LDISTGLCIEEGFHRFPFDVVVLMFGDSNGDLLYYIPITIKGRIAVYCRILQKCLDAFDDSLVAVANCDLYGLSFLFGCRLPNLMRELDAREDAPSVCSRPFWRSWTWSVAGRDTGAIVLC